MTIEQMGTNLRSERRKLENRTKVKRKNEKERYKERKSLRSNRSVARAVKSVYVRVRGRYKKAY